MAVRTVKKRSLILQKMSSRSEHIRQLGLNRKIMYKSGSSSHHAKILDHFDSEENYGLSKNDPQAFISSVISPKPTSSIFQVSVLESEAENQGFLTSRSLTKVNSVPNIMTENITITEHPFNTTLENLMIPYDDPDQEEPMSCDDPDQEEPMLCDDLEQEEPFQDSGSSYKPSGNTES